MTRSLSDPARAPIHWRWRSRSAGHDTVLIEREHIGGTCINEGCTPTKTMIASGRVAYLARRGADYGVGTGELRIDMARIRQRKREIVASFRDGGQSEPGENRSSEVNFRRSALYCCENRGNHRERTERVRRCPPNEYLSTQAAVPPCRPLKDCKSVPYLNSTSIMELDAVPEHLLVLGGGYVGLEFGQLFRRLGSRVTIVQSGPQLLNREDRDIAERCA